jgi:outer membrane translocation and assembly module TamA
VDVNRMNLWGIGHSARLQARYSTLFQRASLSYLAPRFRNVEGRHGELSIQYENTRDVRTFTARSLEGVAQVSQKLSKASTFVLRFDYRDSKVDQSTLKINPLLIPLASQTALVGMLAASFIQDRRDDPFDAHRGIYNTVDFGVAPRIFGPTTQPSVNPSSTTNNSPNSLDQLPLATPTPTLPELNSFIVLLLIAIATSAVIIAEKKHK